MCVAAARLDGDRDTRKLLAMFLDVGHGGRIRVALQVDGQYERPFSRAIVSAIAAGSTAMTGRGARASPRAGPARGGRGQTDREPPCTRAPSRRARSGAVANDAANRGQHFLAQHVVAGQFVQPLVLDRLQVEQAEHEDDEGDGQHLVRAPGAGGGGA